MSQTALAYIVEDTTERLQRHWREISSCGTMLTLLEGAIAPPKLHATITPSRPEDPLDRMILSLCGNAKAAAQPPLHEVVEREASLYRLRVTQGKQHIRKIVMGSTPELRLQYIVNDAVAVAKDELNLPQKPMTKRLSNLTATIATIRTSFPDLIGHQFNLAEAQQLQLPQDSVATQFARNSPQRQSRPQQQTTPT
jgi:hypothetical protein